MNKKYIKPEFTSIEIESESVIADSLDKGSVDMNDKPRYDDSEGDLSSGYRSGLWN